MYVGSMMSGLGLSAVIQTREWVRVYEGTLVVFEMLEL